MMGLDAAKFIAIYVSGVDSLLNLVVLYGTTAILCSTGAGIALFATLNADSHTKNHQNEYCLFHKN